MKSLFLSPHNDDETLSGAYSIMRCKPDVIVVLKSDLQKKRGLGISALERETETAEALACLGVEEWTQWQYRDSDPSWVDIRKDLVAESERYDRVFAPLPEEAGNEHHNIIGHMAAEVWGVESTTWYATYTAGGKSERGKRVSYTGDMVLRKLQAMACYRSQILIEGAQCTAHFTRGIDEHVQDAF